MNYPAQVPTTDPDCHVMPNKEGGYAPNYTPLATTDGERPKRFLTDAGNNSGQIMAGMEERGVEFYAPVESNQPEPWTQVVRAYSFPDVLRQFEQSHPGHPLVAAFKPLGVEDDTELRRDAAVYYRTIGDSDLSIVCKTTLQEVFVSWLEQRFKYLGKKDMEMILLSELPELEETQCGKDLIQIGEARGEARGLAKAIVRY